MHDLARISVLTPSASVADANWKARNVGDFNGDGKDDLIWQDSVNGYLASWYLNGPTVLASVSLVPYQLIDVAWQLQAAADVTGDGHPDLVWHHPTSNSLTVWVMDGISRTGNLTPTPSAANAALWRLAAPR